MSKDKKLDVAYFSINIYRFVLIYIVVYAYFVCILCLFAYIASVHKIHNTPIYQVHAPLQVTCSSTCNYTFLCFCIIRLM